MLPKYRLVRPFLCGCKTLHKEFDAPILKFSHPVFDAEFAEMNIVVKCLCGRESMLNYAFDYMPVNYEVSETDYDYSSIR